MKLSGIGYFVAAVTYKPNELLSASAQYLCDVIDCSNYPTWDVKYTVSNFTDFTLAMLVLFRRRKIYTSRLSKLL